MKVSLLVPLSIGVVACCLSGCTSQLGSNLSLQDANAQAAAAKAPAPVDTAPVNTTPKKTMRAFRSDQELAAYLKKLAVKQKSVQHAPVMSAEVSPAPVATTESRAGADSVTNVQHAGVDEGGIVKVHGNYLVVLRRGRLFTVAIGDGALTPISTIDAFGPDIDPLGTWYDEMLVSEDNVVVIGFSYARGGTEVGLFKIDSAGKLAYRSTYHLRSNDYYSSRNYASRLIGTKLIFYSPLYLDPGEGNPFDSFPAVRKWHKGVTQAEFHRIVSANHVYRTEFPLHTSDDGLALHTVTVCDLAHDNFDCHATSVVGPPGEVFYVSPESVYVWVSDVVGQGEKSHTESMVYRMPLSDTGSAPSALRVSGSPVDQFSFLESEDGYLNVLVRSEAAGDGMWSAEVAEGDVALMRVPLESFSDGRESVPSSRYRRLPKPGGDTFENRFVGDYLLYGTGSGWGDPGNVKQSKLYAVPWSGGKLHTLTLPHGVDRIEQMGRDSVVMGTDGNNLHFTSIRLGPWPEVAGHYVRKNASQGELRSHGFFYKPDTQDSGMLGLPISVPARPGYRHLFENSAAVLFLRNEALHFEVAGELEAQSQGTKDDRCRASCVDWYGNARPLFVRGRVIALLGYELVEGTLEHGRIHEMRRISYAPERVAALSR
jgi:hypothetical protein